MYQETLTPSRKVSFATPPHLQISIVFLNPNHVFRDSGLFWFLFNTHSSENVWVLPCWSEKTLDLTLTYVLKDCSCYFVFFHFPPLKRRRAASSLFVGEDVRLISNFCLISVVLLNFSDVFRDCTLILFVRRRVASSFLLVGEDVRLNFNLFSVMFQFALVSSFLPPPKARTRGIFILVCRKRRSIEL